MPNDTSPISFWPPSNHNIHHTISLIIILFIEAPFHLCLCLGHWIGLATVSLLVGCLLNKAFLGWGHSVGLALFCLLVLFGLYVHFLSLLFFHLCYLLLFIIFLRVTLLFLAFYITHLSFLHLFLLPLFSPHFSRLYNSLSQIYYPYSHCLFFI